MICFHVLPKARTKVSLHPTLKKGSYISYCRVFSQKRDLRSAGLSGTSIFQQKKWRTERPCPSSEFSVHRGLVHADTLTLPSTSPSPKPLNSGASTKLKCAVLYSCPQTSVFSSQADPQLLEKARLWSLKHREVTEREHLPWAGGAVKPSPF